MGYDDDGCGLCRKLLLENCCSCICPGKDCWNPGEEWKGKSLLGCKGVCSDGYPGVEKQKVKINIIYLNVCNSELNKVKCLCIR